MKTISLEIPTEELTPVHLAELFWALDSEQQAQFFNHLGVCALATPAPFSREMNSWFGLDWQMYNAGAEPTALPYAARVMELIGQGAERARASVYPRDAEIARELYSARKSKQGTPST